MVVRAARQPRPGLRAVVVVPARDEEALIGDCVRALRDQIGLTYAEWEIVLVLDGCTDATLPRALEALAGAPEIALHPIEADGLGAGGARAAGMDLACRRLELVGRPEGLIATTDADSRVAPDWLARQLEASATGARAIGGRIDLDRPSRERLGLETLERRRVAHRSRQESFATDGPTEHPFFGGASIGLTASAYREIGGIEPLAALEDEALARRLRSGGIAIHRLDSVQVVTSARTQGRAARGLARDLALSEWSRRRTWEGSGFTLEGLLAAKRASITLILPTKEVAATIGSILDEVAPLQSTGLLDEVIVVDSDSADGTAGIAAGRGVRVLQEADLLPEFGPPRGKGDAIWRSAAAASGELLVLCDSDSTNFDRSFVLGLLGPILTEPGVRLVKGAFERPFRVGERSIPAEGGRVTELLARPLINLHFSELAGLEQPLAGEIAIERELFEQLAVPVGYGVEIAMLIDVARLAGIDAIAQSRLGTRQNRHQPLRALSTMAYEVLVAAQRRLEGGPPTVPGPLVLPGAGGPPAAPRCEERPALASLSETASRGAPVGAASHGLG